jgi:3-phenylpropionate/cinnamic acid dioxygenase small subunit
MATTEDSRPEASDHEEYLRRAAIREELSEWYHEEADQLDDQRLHDWLDRCTEEIDYRVPVRVTRERGAEQSEFSDQNIFEEDHLSLDARVRRFDKEYAWSENPPTRMRRYVTNIQFEPLEDDEEGFSVTTNLLVYRSKEDEVDADIIAGVRHDRLVRRDGELKLDSRRVELDHTVLDTRPLSTFL